MSRRYAVAFLSAALVLSAGAARAQQTMIQYKDGVGTPTNVTPLTPLPVVGGGGGPVTVGVVAASSFPALSPGTQSLYESLSGQLFIDHPTLDVVGPGTGSSALRVAISNDAGSNTVSIAEDPLNVIGTVILGPGSNLAGIVKIADTGGVNQLAVNGSGQIACSNCGGSTSGNNMDATAGPTALDSAGTATLAVNSQGTGATTIVLSGSAGLTAAFQGMTPAGWSAVAAFNPVTGSIDSGATADGQWNIASAGYSQIRVNVSAGTTTASLDSSAGSLAPGLDNGLYSATLPTVTNGKSAPLAIDASARLIVTEWNATPTDKSSNITLGGTSQTLAAANGARHRIRVQNPCSATSQGIGATENLFLRFGAAASLTAGNSMELFPCGSFDSGGGVVESTILTVNAATTAHQFFAIEY